MRQDDHSFDAAARAAYPGRRQGAAAVRRLRRSIILDPADAASWRKLAEAHLTALDAPAAVALLQKLALRCPDLPGLAEALASAYRRDARYYPAAAFAVALPASPSLLYDRALSLLQLGRAADSLAAFDRLLQLAPRHAAGWYWSHAPALDLLGWAEAERRLLRAGAIAGASGKYLALLAAYDRLRGSPGGRPCPTGYRHVIDAAAAIAERTPQPPPLFGVPAATLRFALAQAPAAGLVAEFGVRRGTSLALLAAATPDPVHGFDSFVGLPQGWVGAPAGLMGTGGALPEVAPNVTLHVGWFGETLPGFLARHPEPLRFANIDCDIYASTRTVLWALAERIVPGSVLLFDELIGNRSWRQDEYRALTEFSTAFRRDWQVLAVNPSAKQVAIRFD